MNYFFLLAFLSIFAFWAVLTVIMILKSMLEVLEFIAIELRLSLPQPSATKVEILLDGKRGSAMQVSDSGSVAASLAFVNAKGNEVAGVLDASPSPLYSLDDPSFGDLSPSADGLSCGFAPNGKLGVVHMLFKGGLGGVEVNAVSEDIEVVPGPAVGVKLVLK